MSIFQDTIDIYSDNWFSSPWKNYTLLPTDSPGSPLTDKTVGFVNETGVTFKVYCLEEEWLNYRLRIQLTDNGGSNDTYIFKLQNRAGDTDLSTSSTGMIWAGVQSTLVTTSSTFDDFKSWIAPGLGLRCQTAPDGKTTFTANDRCNIDVAKDSFGVSDFTPLRKYDGGAHCWVKLNHAVDTWYYSKPLPASVLGDKDCLLIWNALSHYRMMLAGGNSALTLALFGSMDGTNYVNVMTLANDVNPYDATSAFVSDTHQLKVEMRGIGFDKYPYYKIGWQIENSTGTETVPIETNFIRMSIYTI